MSGQSKSGRMILSRSAPQGRSQAGRSAYPANGEGEDHKKGRTTYGHWMASWWGAIFRFRYPQASSRVLSHHLAQAYNNGEDHHTKRVHKRFVHDELLLENHFDPYIIGQ